MLEMLQHITAQRCKDWGGERLEFNGEADPVHVLMSLPPNLDLSRFVNNLKTTSSRLVRREFSFGAYSASRCSGPGLTASSPAAAHRRR
jgi:REP-associated tyrosine transposase